MSVKADRYMEDEFYEENLKYSFNNGESWHTEDEIKEALHIFTLMNDIVEGSEALKAKGKSCENCTHIHKKEGYADYCIKLDLQQVSYGYCPQHEPK